MMQVFSSAEVSHGGRQSCMSPFGLAHFPGLPCKVAASSTVFVILMQLLSHGFQHVFFARNIFDPRVTLVVSVVNEPLEAKDDDQEAQENSDDCGCCGVSHVVLKIDTVQIRQCVFGVDGALDAFVFEGSAF